MKRRQFINRAAAISALPMFSYASRWSQSAISHGPGSQNCGKIKISLNAYSFNDPLRDGSMSLDDLLGFCSGLGFDAVDLTAYYFPGYPEVPPDEYIYKLKRNAFLLGLDISGTGVRNDFTDPDKRNRENHIKLVKNWIECAAKLGAPVIRIFAGTQNPPGYSWDQIAEWMVEDILVCVEYGKKHGVMVAVQNHDDFIKNSDQVKKLMNMVDSEWFGLILDTGSYREGDPYQQIAETIHHAVNWQIKEKIFVNGMEQDTDLEKLIGIIKASCYKGYLPLETLGAGDPKEKVKSFLERFQKTLG